jgi:hypothetical protein
MLMLKMRSLTSIIVFATTISALPITSDISTPGSADALDNIAITTNIAATANTNDGPRGHGPPGGNYGPPPGYGYGPGPGPGYGGGRGGPSLTGGLDSVAYGLGTIIGAPVGLLGEVVGGVGSGIYNGIRGGYKLIKG